MKLTESQLRQIIREELMESSFGTTQMKAMKVAAQKLGMNLTDKFGKYTLMDILMSVFDAGYHLKS